MSERDGYHPGVPCWIDTWQADAEAAVAFYSELFGWEVEDTMPPDVDGNHFMCRLRGRDVAAVASRPGAAPTVSSWNTYIWVESADEAAAAAPRVGGSVVIAPFESLDGGRIAVLADPAGASIAVWQPGAHRGAQLVSEPGAWSMSQLRSPDPRAPSPSTAPCSAGRPRCLDPPTTGSRSGASRVTWAVSSISPFPGTSSR